MKKLRQLRHEIPSFWKKLMRERIRALSFVVALLFFLSFPSFSYYGLLILQPQPPLVNASPIPDFKPSLYPLKFGQDVAPYVSAQSVMIVDLESGTPFFEINPHARLYPASITKLMTALVALEYFPLDKVLTVQRLSPEKDEADMGLSVGDKLTFRGLLYGLLIPSGNDAAYTIADNYPGGIENFVYAMNKKARDLNMQDTHFANPSGLDNLQNYSSAHDVSLLARAALRNELVSKIVATYGTTLSDTTHTKTYYLKNVNQFLGYLYGADGIKTGFTDLAGQCLVASVSRGGHRVISVVLNSKDRFADSARLIEWVFANFTWVSPNSGDIFVPIKNG